MGTESQVAAVMASRLNPISKIMVMRRMTVLVVFGSWLKRYRTPAIIITIKHNNPDHDCDKVSVIWYGTSFKVLVDAGSANGGIPLILLHMGFGPSSEGLEI
jgi:hypothetical protein